MENPIKMDDLGVPLFLETPIYIHDKIALTTLSSVWIPPTSYQFELLGNDPMVFRVRLDRAGIKSSKALMWFVPAMVLHTDFV